MSYGSFFNGRAMWIVFVGITFVCCSLIIYNTLLHYKTRCTSQESCSNSYQSESAKLSSENCKNSCNTTECIQIANFILNNMNRSADPCKDFSTFACGNYGDQFERGNSNNSILDDLADNIKVMIKDIIETSNETSIPGSAAKKLKIVYDSCMNSKASDLSAIRSIKQFLNQMGIPNWPHLDPNFSFRYSTFEETVGKLIPYQEDIFIRFIRLDPEMPYLQQQAASLQGHYNITVASQNPTYHDDREVEKLKNVVMGILHYTGMDNKDINRTWEEFLDVENQLRNLSTESTEANPLCEDEEEPTTEAVFVDCSHINTGETMLCRIWDSVIRNGRIATYVNKDQVKINCKDTHYIEKLSSILNSYNHRTLAHYIALRVFINNLKYMSFPIRKNVRYIIRRFDFVRVDNTFYLDHWKFCVSWIAENMKSPLGLMYVNRILENDATDLLDDILNEYKQNVLETLEKQDWMDEDTQQILLRWVNITENYISEVIGLYRNKTKINSDYRKFQPIRNDFFRNVMRHKKLQFIGKYWMTFAETEIQDLPLYQVQANGGIKLFVAFGMLQPPFFKYGYPKLFNIARIGQLIGHELGHQMMYYLNPALDELSHTTRQHSRETRLCVINQYSNYELKRIKQKVKGHRTIDENLCDNLSIKLTEKIAKQLIRTMEEDNFSLPGLPYSPEELFYISNAQLWCEIRSIEKEYDQVDMGHSPAEYRAIGVLQNSRRFSEVFHCPSTSYMNPEKKCSVFD